MPLSTEEIRAAAHARAITWVFGISLVLALLSFFLALLFRHHCYRGTIAYVIVALWVAIPPLWFLWEYVHFRPPEGIEDERMRHLHDLCRNIWLALIVILVAIMEIPWPGAP